MCLAIVVALLLLAITSQPAGPEFVTHDCALVQPGSFIDVSPALCRLVADRRLFVVVDRVYRPRPQRSPSAVLVALLLLLGGIENNPGPSASSSVGLLNARSACHKAALIHDVIADNKLDTLLLTETWIPSDAPDAVKLDVAPSGYAAVHRHRAASTERRGGGLAVIHSDSFRATLVDVGDHTEFEALAVRLVSRRSASVVVVCVYRPPGAITSAFIDQLSDLLDRLATLDSGFVVAGDFNAPGDVDGLDSKTADVFTRYALTQHVRSSTHRDGNVLDLILSRDDDTPRGQLISDVAVQSVCFSDHHLVTCRLGIPPPPPPVTTSFTYRSLRRIDMQAFRQDILQSRLYGSLQSDVDEYADLFDAEVTRVLNTHAPLRTGRRRCSGQHDVYVLSDEARDAKRRRRRLERRYRRTRAESDKQAYNTACTAARDSIMTSRADHIRTQLEQASGDIRATWRTAQTLLHSRQKVVYDDAECADLVDKFSQFFVDKVRRIRDNISSALQQQSSRVFAARQHTGPELSAFQPATIDEVRKLLTSMPRKTSPLDVLPVSLLKDCADVFAPAITTLANLSLRTGRFPARFKSAQVLPLLKKAGLDRSSPANYRPISNLSTVSKVLERLVLARLRPHLTNSKNFSRRQSAYRQGHSTETALLDVLDSVYTAADNKEVTVLIGLDLSAAFDTVCHSTLTQRLQTEFGVSGTVLSWLQSYLHGRTQFVKLGQHRSSEATMEVGVPQGSVLGPLLFAVYCSPVANIIDSHGVRHHQYADDTQLHLAMRANDTADGQSVLAACTTDVKQWYMQNGLQLNPDKSEVLLTGTATQLRAVSSLTSVSVAGVDLPVADSMRVLGVTLDRRLTFDNHVSAVARSCNYHVHAIRHIRHLLTLDLAQTLACSLILSRIDYCNAVLHGCPSGTIHKLQRVQNNAARAVLQAPRRSHVGSLLQELHWLPVEQRITYKLAVLTYKTRQTSVPRYLSQHVTACSSTRSLRSSSAPLLHVPFRRTTFGKRSFSSAAPSVWNSLPPSVLNSLTLTLFKSRLKTYLFSSVCS